MFHTPLRTNKEHESLKFLNPDSVGGKFLKMAVGNQCWLFGYRPNFNSCRFLVGISNPTKKKIPKVKNPGIFSGFSNPDPYPLDFGIFDLAQNKKSRSPGSGFGIPKDPIPKPTLKPSFKLLNIILSNDFRIDFFRLCCENRVKAIT